MLTEHYSVSANIYFQNKKDNVSSQPVAKKAHVTPLKSKKASAAKSKPINSDSDSDDIAEEMLVTNDSGYRPPPGIVHESLLKKSQKR